MVWKLLDEGAAHLKLWMGNPFSMEILWWKEFERNFKIKLGGLCGGEVFRKRWMSELIGSWGWRMLSGALSYKRHFVFDRPSWRSFITFMEKGPYVNIGCKKVRHPRHLKANSISCWRMLNTVITWYERHVAVEEIFTFVNKFFGVKNCKILNKEKTIFSRDPPPQKKKNKINK